MENIINNLIALIFTIILVLVNVVCYFLIDYKIKERKRKK